MATTTKPAGGATPAKKSTGFTGVRGAFWIIIACAIFAFLFFFLWFGNGMHFEGGDPEGEAKDVWGLIFKGGVIVPVIHTLLLTVLAMSIERWLAL